jgi:hypoxanthine phosphoribosyltransferase
MKKSLISYNDYKNLINKICRDINVSDWRPDYVVGITRGGLLPAVMISQYFDIPCETLKISLRDGSEQESNLWMSEDAYGYNADEVGDPCCKNILVVDDINDTGATLNWLMKDWQSNCLPSDARWDYVWNQNVKFAVVVDNLASDCTVKMDYVGMEVNKAEDNVWIEFPYEEWWTK